MSRTNEIVDNTNYERPEALPSYALQQYCQYCCDCRVNAVGHLSVQAKAWFCSGACYNLFSYENKTAEYSQPVIRELIRMRTNCYSLDMINRRRKRLNLPTIVSLGTHIG